MGHGLATRSIGLVAAVLLVAACGGGAANPGQGALAPESLTVAFAEVDQTRLAASFQSSKVYIDPDDGYISQSHWDTGLSAYADWAISGFSATDPASSYRKRVDTSLYQRALGRPKS